MRALNTRLYFSILLLTTLALLQACTSTGSGYYNPRPWLPPTGAPIKPAQEIPGSLSITAVNRQSLNEPNTPSTRATHQKPYSNQTKQQSPNIKVAILLPLSGLNEKIGQSMLGAAQMAAFDIGHKNFELMPYDTQGTPAGARTAAHNALRDGNALILGPVFSSSVKAAHQVLQNTRVNMIAFSTDWTLANEHTFLIGFLPFDQIERIVHYAATAQYKNICVISPKDTYGNAVVSAYQSITSRTGLNPTCIQRFSDENRSLSDALRNLSRYDQRNAAKKQREEDFIAQGMTPEDAHKAAMQETPEERPFDAILMPVGGPLAREVGNFLNHYDLPPQSVRRLGTGLMDDNTLAQDSSLNGAWFAAPEPASRIKFETRYSKLYSQTPPRLASLAYDATALSAILSRIGLRKNGKPAYDQASLTNPNGFSGIDGIFRFRRDGIVERGLAVLEYRDGSINIIDRAPTTFQNVAH